MSKQKAPPEKREHKKDDHRKPPEIHRDGRDRQVIFKFAGRRLAGGEPPLPATYAGTLMQWQQLPGAPVRDAGTLTDGGCDGN
jgi:hypothetical protein